MTRKFNNYVGKIFRFACYMAVLLKKESLMKTAVTFTLGVREPVGIGTDLFMRLVYVTDSLIVLVSQSTCTITVYLGTKPSWLSMFSDVKQKLKHARHTKIVKHLLNILKC